MQIEDKLKIANDLICRTCAHVRRRMKACSSCKLHMNYTADDRVDIFDVRYNRWCRVPKTGARICELKRRRGF
jgi:hypothetical protein